MQMKNYEKKCGNPTVGMSKNGAGDCIAAKQDVSRI